MYTRDDSTALYVKRLSTTGMKIEMSEQCVDSRERERDTRNQMQLPFMMATLTKLVKAPNVKNA